MSNSKISTKVTPERRTKEFEEGTFYATPCGLLCSTCNVEVDFRRKHSCLRHLDTAMHKKMLEDLDSANARKSVVSDSLLQDGLAEKEREKQSTLLSLVDAFACANIPLNALDNISSNIFLQAHLKTPIPSAAQLRRYYLPKAFDVHVRRLEDLLAQRFSLAIVCDKTTDAEDRYVLSILAAPNCKDNEVQLKAFLLDCVVLDSTNYKTVSEAVRDVTFKYNISPLRVSALVTDNAAYMYKAWNSSLRAVWMNAVHVTCTAHILNLVCEVWLSSFPEVNKLVCGIKKAFTACPARKARFKLFMMERGKFDCLPTTPVVTRWNSWFKAALFHADRLEEYSEFFHCEARSSSSLDAAGIVNLCQSRDIGVQLDQLKKYAPHLMATLIKYKGNDLRAHSVIDDLELLVQWFELSSEHDENLAQTNAALRNSSGKLKSYISGDESHRFRQPAANLFRAVRIFDPSRASIMRMLTDFIVKNIPWFEDNIPATAELKVYLSSVGELFQPASITAFWTQASIRFPKLSEIALSCLSIPVNSVAAERSFSQYSCVLRDDRRSIKEGNLSMYNLLYQNSGLI